MQIVIDTTVLRQDRRLESSTSATFLEGLKLIPAALYVPEIVVDEAVNLFRRDLLCARQAAVKAELDLCRLLSRPRPPQQDGGGAACQVGDYRRALTERIGAFGGKVMPYPKIEHKKVVERDLTARRPFREGGTGYRDTLVWETVRNLTWGGNERVVFVTGNSRDFGQGPSVHDDLVRDVTNPGRLRLFPDLAALNKELILPKMAMLEKVRADLESECAGTFALASWVRERLLSVLQYQHDDLAGIVAGFPHGVGSAWPSGIVEMKEFRVTEVLALGDHQLLIRIEIHFDADISISWDYHDYLASNAVREWDPEANPGTSSATASVTDSLQVCLDLVVERTTGAVQSEEITYMAGPAGEADYGSSIKP